MYTIPTNADTPGREYNMNLIIGDIDFERDFNLI